MADFNVLADVGGALLRMLRENLCPDPIQSPESILLASPNDKNGDFRLGVFLYDLRELSEYRSSETIQTAQNLRRYPPMALTLSYLLFMNGKAQLASSAEAEHRIFGKAIQTLLDNPVLDISEVNPFIDAGEATYALAMLNPSFEDKSKIWSTLSIPYQMGLYFTVSPVLITPKREEPITRVTGLQIGSGPAERKPNIRKPGGRPRR